MVYLRFFSGIRFTMRLGQLARKLAVRPSEIVEFLAARQITLDEGSNTRLEDAHVVLVMAQFAPDHDRDLAVVAAAPEEVNTFIAPVTAVPELEPESGTPESGAGNSNNESYGDDHSNEKTVVIKAPKVELSGLKVLGKIDLPEARKKEIPVPDTEGTEVKPIEHTKAVAGQRKVSPYNKKENSAQRLPRKNPIALQRERDTQEAEQKRQAREEQEKEKRTNNYYKKIKASAPTKRVKMVEEPTTEMSADELKEVPGTWLGRFFHWLKH
jgi:hypothetical protein